MEHIPKYNIYKEPDGYFDTLPGRIFHKNKLQKRRLLFTRIAAAAVLIIGVAFFIFNQPAINEAALQAQLDQEVELYISSGYWDAEDVLLFSENPDELLDVIIEEEWSSYTINGDQMEDEFWY